MQAGTLEEVLLLERCDVLALGAEHRLAVGGELALFPALISGVLLCSVLGFLTVLARSSPGFDSGDPLVFLECGGAADCASWLAALRDANTETLRRRITQLNSLLNAAGRSGRSEGVTNVSQMF